MERDYKTSLGKHQQQTAADPMAFQLVWAKRKGWELGPNNLFVEGETDYRYLTLATRLHAETTGLHLSGHDLVVVPLGMAMGGGTSRIETDLRPLFSMRADFGISNKKDQCRVVLLLDDDDAGRGAFRKARKWLREGIDVFLLHRIYSPVDTPTGFNKKTEELNKATLEAKLDCEIEDLVSKELVMEFLKENPGCRESVIEAAGEMHISVRGEWKGNLRRYIEEMAMHRDVERLVDLLRAFRSLLRLPVDGVPPGSAS